MNFTPKIVYVELGSGLTKTITFSSPPESDPFNEEIEADAETTETSNGNYQTQWNRSIENLTLEFRHESYAIKTQVANFFKNHAGKGGSFDYYPHSDLSDYNTYRMVTTKLKFDRALPDGSNDFLYNFQFKIRRTLDLTYESEGLGVSAINETYFALTDNISSWTDIEGLSFDKTSVGAAHIQFYIYRNTTGAGAEERSSAGMIRVSYNQTADDWELDVEENNFAGIEFNIDSDGQVQYKSNNDPMTGTPDEDYIKFRADTFSQGA